MSHRKGCVAFHSSNYFVHMCVWFGGFYMTRILLNVSSNIKGKITRYKLVLADGVSFLSSPPKLLNVCFQREHEDKVLTAQ